MRIATVDVGTNSTRILIAYVEKGEVRPLFKTGKVTRLGRGVRERGELSREGIEATLGALEEFKRLVEDYGVEKVIVATTEAARLARNSEEFLRRVRELGFEIEVLSDREEAELVFLANLKVFGPRGKAMTVDLGGGSTEIVYGDRNAIDYLKSLKFGVVFLYEEFGENLPALEEFIRGELLKVKEEIDPREPFTVFAVGGTITSVVAMEEKMEVYRPEVVHGYKVTREMVEKWYGYLSSLSVEERKRVVGLEEKRTDVIIPGLAFFRVFCDVFGTGSLTVSEVGLLYGLALREAVNG